MRILGDQIALKANLQRSVTRYWYLWLVLLVTTYLDFKTTLSFMVNEGVHLERNPIIYWLVINLGILPGVIAGKALQLFAAAIFCALSPSLSWLVLLLLSLVNMIAIHINWR